MTDKNQNKEQLLIEPHCGNKICQHNLHFNIKMSECTFVTLTHIMASLTFRIFVKSKKSGRSLHILFLDLQNF